MKNDPGHVAAARELRDRWLEKVNADPSPLPSGGKYDVSKELTAPTVEVVPALPALPDFSAVRGEQVDGSQHYREREALRQPRAR